MSSSQGEVEMLSKLADQYRDTGKINPRKNWTDILKAHTLYNACASRSSNKKWQEKAFEVQKTYWGDDVASTLEEQTEIAHDLQAELTTIRDKFRGDLSPVTGLINRWDCTTENLDSLDNKEAAGQLVKGMKDLSFGGNVKMKVFAGKVIQKSIELNMKKVPCKFAAVALGSMAKGEATPYSDLEFIFLLEKKTEEIVEFFETLAMSVYFLIGNLQETKLKYMNIEELKTFKDKSKNGFKIDGLQSKAGNIPTGNGTAEQHNKFILTVDELLDKYQHIFLNPDPEESKKGDFTSMLAHTTVIYGEPSLLIDFEQRKKKVTVNKARMSAHNNMIKQDVEDYDFLPLGDLKMNNHCANLKSAIYRFPSLLTYNLKIIYNIESKSSWETLEKLRRMKKLSDSYFASLKFLLATALYIRMAAYLHHDSQNDDMTFVPSSNPSIKGRFWHIQKPLYMHMSLHMIPVKQTIAESNDPLHAVTTEITYDTNVVSAHINYNAGYHSEAIRVLELLTVKRFNELAMLADSYMNLHRWNNFQPAVHNVICYIQARPCNRQLGSWLPFFKYKSAEGYAQAGDLVSAKSGYEQVLSELPTHLFYDIEIYANASNFYLMIGHDAKSKHYYERAGDHLEQIAPKIGQSLCDMYRTVMLHNRAVDLKRRGWYRDAEVLLLQNIQLLKTIYGENGICIQLAHSYRLLGSVYGGLGQLDGSIDHIQKALGYIHKAEEHYELIAPAREETNLASRYEGFAVVYHQLGYLDTALEYYRKILDQIEKHQEHNGPDMARLKNRIGTVLILQDKYDEEADTFLKDSMAIYNTLNDSLYNSGLAKCHLDYGDLCLHQDRHADSLDHYYKATSFRHKSDDIDHVDTVCLAWAAIGKNSMKMHKYEEAGVSFEKSTNLHHPRSEIHTEMWAMIYFNLGQCYLWSSKTKTAWEKLLVHTKAHKASVTAMKLLINNPNPAKDYKIYFIKVAALMCSNFLVWSTVSL